MNLAPPSPKNTLHGVDAYVYLCVREREMEIDGQREKCVLGGSVWKYVVCML